MTGSNGAKGQAPSRQAADGNGVLPPIGGQKTWQHYGYQRDLPAIPAPPRALRALDPEAAKAQIREIVGQGGGGPVSIMRGDGRRDTILNLIKTPDGLDDVYVTESFIDHIIDKKDDHREQFAHYILPSLQDPAEVWLTAVEVGGKPMYRRYFLTAFEGINTVAVVEEMALGNKDAWLLWTFFPRKDINRARVGIRLYGRDKEL